MQILARYIAGSFFKNIVMTLFGLTALFFFQSVITQLNDFTLGELLIYSYFDIPKMLVMVAPPAALMATVLTLSTLSKTNELVACFSIGISIEQIIGILIPIVFVLCCLSLVIQDRILPAFHEKKTLFYWREIRKKQDFYLDVKQDRVWYRSDQMIYNLRTFDPKTDQISGIGVYVFDDQFQLQELLQAERADYQVDEKQWLMKDGKATRFDSETGFPVIEDFKTRPLKIKEGPKDFKMIEREVDRLRIVELYRFIQANKKSGVDSRAFEVKFHSRFSLSFIPLVMALLAVPFSISRTREGRLARDLGIAFAMTLVYWIGYSISLSLGTKGTIPPLVAAWAPTIAFGSLAVILLKRMQR